MFNAVDFRAAESKSESESESVGVVKILPTPTPESESTLWFELMFINLVSPSGSLILSSFSRGREFEQTGRLETHKTGAAPEPAFGAVSFKACNALVSLDCANKCTGKI